MTATWHPNTETPAHGEVIILFKRGTFYALGYNTWQWFENMQLATLQVICDCWMPVTDLGPPVIGMDDPGDADDA